MCFFTIGCIAQEVLGIKYVSYKSHEATFKV